MTLGLKIVFEKSRHYFPHDIIPPFLEGDPSLGSLKNTHLNSEEPVGLRDVPRPWVQVCMTSP